MIYSRQILKVGFRNVNKLFLLHYILVNKNILYYRNEMMKSQLKNAFLGPEILNHGKFSVKTKNLNSLLKI